MKKFALLGLAGTAAASALMATPAQAVTFFTDRALFEAALENIENEDFQSFAEGFQTTSFDTTTDVTITCNDTGSTPACPDEFFLPEIADKGSFLDSLNPNPTPTGDLVLDLNVQDFGFFGATYTSSFAQSVVGFGFDLLAGNLTPDDDILLTADGISPLLINIQEGVAEQGFFGFVGHPGETFDSFTLAAASGGTGASIGIDNLAYATTLAETEPEPVPEPASMLGLLTVGAVAAGGALKRKQAAKA